MRFVLSVIKALVNSYASEIFKDNLQCKLIANKLVDKLEPPKLKMWIINKRAFWSKDEKGSLQHFMKRASVLAVEVCNGKIARKQIPPKRKLKRKFNEDSEIPESSGQPRFEGWKVREGISSKPVNRNKLAHNRFADRWNKNCLSPDCSGIHRVQDYNIT